MYFIDFHAHVYPDAIAAKAADSIRAFYDFGNKAMDGKVATLLQRGELAGIQKFVILPVAIRPEHTRSINNFIIGQVSQESRFYGYGAIHAATEHIENEVQYIMEQGLRGIKMHPDSQIFPIDDPRLFPVYEMAQDKLPILFHMGDHRFDYSHPQRLRHVLELFPKLTVIAAHFGGYGMYDIAAQVLKDKNCFLDVSSSLMFMEPGVAEKYIRHYGAERFVYGSDFPMWDPVKEMNRFLQLKLTDEELEQIAHKTADRLLAVV